MWLKIKEGETVNAVIDLSSVKTIVKHWTGQRSELCLGEGCPHCLARIPKRWRYQARLIVARENYQWEFGEQVMVELNKIPHDTNLANISLTRIGDVRNTRYEISAGATQHLPAFSYAARAEELTQEYIRSKHGDSSEREEG